jgi:hypothetical protein
MLRAPLPSGCVNRIRLASVPLRQDLNWLLVGLNQTEEKTAGVVSSCIF